MYNDELTKKLAETARQIMAGESVETPIEEAAKTGDKEAYQKFFNDTLKKYGVESPAELSDEDKKKFFDEIDAGWEGDNEKPEKNESVELEEAVKYYKTLSDLKRALEFDVYGEKTFKKLKIVNLKKDIISIQAPSGQELDRYQLIPKLGWTELAMSNVKKESTEELEDDEGNVEEGLIGGLIKKGARRFLTRKGRNDAREKKLKKLRSKETEIRRSKQLKRDIKTARQDVRKARRESTEELGEGKIDLNKKFNTSDAAFDYFHSFAVADQVKTDQEVEKSKKKFAKNTLGFWMQNLTDTLKGMGISEDTELELTEEEDEEIIASILDTIPDAEAAADDDNHPDEDDMLATLDKTTGYKVVDNLPEEAGRLDARRREFREKIRKLAYEKAKKMVKGITDAADEEETVEGVDKPLKVQKDEATGAVSVSHVKEEIEESTEELEEKRKSKSDYETYHDSYFSALNEVLDLVERNGYKVDEDLWFTKVSTGPRKPSAGKTNSFTIELEKDGKPTRKVVSFQVYGLESGRYELNAYIS